MPRLNAYRRRRKARRKKMAAAVRRGADIYLVAHRFGVSHQTVKNALAEFPREQDASAESEPELDKLAGLYFRIVV